MPELKAEQQIREVLNVGAQKLLGRYGLQVLDMPKSSIYLSYDNSKPNVELYMDFGDGWDSLRFSLTSKDNLTIGYSGSTLFTVHGSKHDDIIVRKIQVISDIINHEQEWIDLLKSLPIHLLIEEKEAIEAEAKRKKEKQEKSYLDAYNTENIVIGTILLDKWKREYVVTRMSGKKIQLNGKLFYEKLEIGKYLLNKEWEVKGDSIE